MNKQSVNIDSIFGYKSLTSLIDSTNVMSVLESIDSRLQDLVKNSGKAPKSSDKKEDVNGAKTAATSFITLRKLMDVSTNVDKILKLLENKDQSNSEKQKKETVLEKAEGITLLGSGMIKIFTAMQLAKLVSRETTDNVIYTLKGLAGATMIFAQAMSKAPDVDKAFGNLAKGIFLLGFNLVLSWPLYKLITTTKIVSLVNEVVDGLLSVFTKLTPSQSKQISEGSKALSNLAKGVFFLGLALVAAIPLYLIGIIAVPLVALSLYVLGLAFTLIGKLDKNIQKGASAMNAMSIAIVGFTIGLLVWAAFKPPIESTFELMLTVAGVGLVFALVGLAKDYIVKGAIALAVASLSVIFFTFAIKEWMKLGINFFSFDENGANQVGMMGSLLASILGLGAVMSLAGLLKSQIIGGSIAMIVAGAALIVISFGVKEFMKANPTWEQVGIMGATITGLGLVMSGAGFLSGLILLGSAAMILAGSALYIIATAVNKFAQAGIKVSTGDDLSGVNKQIECVIGSIVESFTINPFKTAAMLISTPILLLAGGALILIGKALAKFRESGFDNVDTTNVLMTNVNTIITGLTESFSNVSDSAAAMAGIESTQNIGNSLVGMATGLMKFAELDKNFPGLDFTPGSNLMMNIRSIITGVSTAFAEAGATGIIEEAETAINATKNIGTSLMGIADGIMKFTDPKFTTTFAPDPATGKSKMMDLVINMIKSVMGAFAEIGGKNSGGSNLFGFTITEGDVDKGISLTIRSADALSSIADGVMKFKDFTPEQISTANSNIKSIITSLLGEFGSSNAETKLKNADRYVRLIEKISKLTSPLSKVADSMSKIAKETGNMVKHLEGLDSKKYDNYVRWTEAIVKIGEVDNENFGENTKTFLDSASSAIGNMFSSNSNNQTPAVVSTSPVTETTIIKEVSSTGKGDSDLITAIQQLTNAILANQTAQSVQNADMIQKLSKLPMDIANRMASQTLTIKTSY